MFRAQRLATVFRKRGELDQAEHWRGWRVGNLRPVFEPISWLFKPYAATIADNVLDHGLGAFNLEGFEALVGGHDNIIRMGFRPGEAGHHEAQKPVDLLRALPSLDALGSLEGWLYRATIHRCWKRLRRERFLSLPAVRWLIGGAQEEPVHPEPAAAARHDLTRAFDALEALPPKERIAFTMFHLDGKSQDEIGCVLGHKKSYVCKLIQRATEHLRARGWEVPDAAP